MGTDGGGFAELCDLDGFIDDLAEDDPDDAGKEYKVGDETTVDGENAVEVISTEATRRPRRWWHRGRALHPQGDKRGRRRTGSFTLGGFNEPVVAEAPDDAVELPKE